MARLGVGYGGGFPGWIWAKLTIWGILGAVLFLARARPGWSLPLFALVPLLAALAGYVAFTKPF